MPRFPAFDLRHPDTAQRQRGAWSNQQQHEARVVHASEWRIGRVSRFAKLLSPAVRDALPLAERAALHNPSADRTTVAELEPGGIPGTSGQTTESQRRELEAVAARRGWRIVQTYEDAAISGAKGRDKRPGLDAMMKDAARGRIDMVMVWAVDRLGRSTATVAPVMAELGTLGIGFYADEEGMDATTAHGRAMLQMASVSAELERAMIVERVRAGMARAKVNPRAGAKAIGRPTVGLDKETSIRGHLAAGTGIVKVAKLVGVGVGTVQRVKATLGGAAA